MKDSVVYKKATNILSIQYENDVTENPFIYSPKEWWTKHTKKIEQIFYKKGRKHIQGSNCVGVFF